MERIIVLVLLFVSQICITVDAEITYADSGCKGDDYNYTHGGAYEKNLGVLLSYLATKSSSLKFDNYTVGDASNRVYGLFQCRNDIGLDLCSECVQAATREVIHMCHTNGEGNVWYYECMLRYAKRNIFSLCETSPSVYKWSKDDNVTDYHEFAPKLASSMDDLIKNASSALPHFASTETDLTLLEKLYSFAQCTPDIDSLRCSNCLKSAYSEMKICCNASIRATVFMPSCQLRYDMSPFLIDPPPPAPKSKKTVMIGAVAGCVVLVLLVLCVALWIYSRCKKSEDEKVYSSHSYRIPPGSPRGLNYGAILGEEDYFGDIEFVQYDFATLKNATKKFSNENKLGEGGFGIVYKGTLQNGEQLAIKRLSGTSGQGAREFMTEARLLAKLQHRNLVKLVGFCSKGEEKLLVYEFMSNSSLDRFLFDPHKRPLLDWIIRCKIIMGIARGLQYLHEDSRLTIIHRDLKPGNILLDKEMNPKIADFGLAKLFEDDAQKLGNTNRVVGTKGYMAPEYMMTGDYSDKSDVYSFGIMLLEIVSGRKNKISDESSQTEDLSTHAWRLWSEERSLELTDPILINNCSSNEVKRCIQIGLLCVQANPKQRPTMALVIFMLTGSVNLPSPPAPLMSSLQVSIPMNYSGGHQSDADQSSTMSATTRGNETEDLYPKPK